MLRVAALIWIMLATTLAGITLLVIVTVPALSQNAGELLPIACGAAMVVAMPISYVIARMIARTRTA